MKELYIDEHAAGCIQSKKDLRDYRLNKNIAMGDLPEEFSVEHSPIKNQGGVCSCVAHAVAEVLEAISKNTEKYSTNWIYGYRPTGYHQGKGMSTRQAIKTTCDVGYVLYEDFAGNDEMKAVKEAVDKNLNFLRIKASERKAYSYAALTTREEIKKAIYLTKNPVVLCVHCCNPFETDEEGVLVYSNKFGGYHAMVCYGWNEKGLLIQNSWGENWANNGTCILPDNYPFSEAWMIADSEEKYLIVRPSGYWWRKLLQAIINFIVRMFQK